MYEFYRRHCLSKKTIIFLSTLHVTLCIHLFMVWYGVWHKVYGIWYMVRGIWHMVCGIWYMVYCIWYMVYGIGNGIICYVMLGLS